MVFVEKEAVWMTSVLILLAETMTIVAVVWWLRGQHFKTVALAGAIGMAMGALTDWFLGYEMGLYHYTHHAYWSPDYFYLIYPAWAMSGIITWEIWMILEEKLRSVWWRLLAVAVLMAGYSELVGLLRNCWHYTCPLWVAGIGWLAYVFVLVLLVNIFTYGKELFGEEQVTKGE